ncbi:dihydrofolate reductase [Nakamurella flava]|uniref:Dihydrofolate reductase n=1 Tax=Nakamurella flava TaxID=2576308 RepID=A0A4U6QLV7_9ACTN|nr:dihydrofolate reductase family protein [Nakamurella flava]TKV61118.1 dihydrofolate reductase [Nakamurella flava]
MRVIVINHLSLDGVLQAPGGPDEDPRDGFRHGGWAALGGDPSIPEAMGASMGAEFSWLFNRRTNEQLLTRWNQVGGPFADSFNQLPKYVVSGRPDTVLRWPNSTLLHGDVPAGVAELREQSGGNLMILGSGALVRSLLPHGLIDELLLMIHPVVLGSGQRLFGPDDYTRRLELVDSRSTATGVLLATHRSTDARPNLAQPADRACAAVAWCSAESTTSSDGAGTRPRANRNA